MSRTLIIASAAYAGSELEAEFGRLPPSFLPVGNRRLFTHQHAALGHAFGRVILSLPEDFIPEPMDAAALDRLGVEVVPVPVGLTLGQSLVYVLNVTASAAGPVSVLHGDTLLEGLDPQATDGVSVGLAQHDYSWGYALRSGETVVDVRREPPAQDGAAEVLSGYFQFSSAATLIQEVTRNGGDFVGALAAYAGKRPLRALPAARWLDFGHLNTYHRSRRQMTTERAFNRLSSSRRIVEKSGRDPAKIEAEARWFETLPPPMRLFAPAFLGLRREGEALSYAIEYLYQPTLADLYVFGRLPRSAWTNIFAGCDEFLAACASHPAPPATRDDVRAIYAGKTLERLEAHARARGLDLAAPCRLNGAWLPSLERMAILAAGAVAPASDAQLTMIHGDFCFSNILYDTRADMIRVIDPRGLSSQGTFSSHGDRRYDLAKLYHSVIGRYDHILAGAAALRASGPLDFQLDLPAAPDGIEAEFLSARFGGLSMEEAQAPAIAVLLFLSMLPLHADDPCRQDALLANAMRLFLRLEQGRAGTRAA